MSPDNAKGEYIVEFQQHGSSVKVSAIDPVTMMEVSIVGPSSVGQEELKRTALAKLHYVMNKKNGRPAPENNSAPAVPKKPGIVV
ncbi:hypothetical protein [Sneathiella sp.]|uniref:DUF6898 family protein n=1 Tax=Sneathiella sp. TaxID=1964365 RepID=UPI00262673F6|nr:hypothetical protein [Sneathiella sp.]MDF2366483.1 hypothetical protein [Sneathiella sp.]